MVRRRAHGGRTEDRFLMVPIMRNDMRASGVHDRPESIDRHGGRMAHVDPGEPGGDPPVIGRIEDIEPHASIQARPMHPDKARLTKQMELSSDRRSTQGQLSGKTRRPPWADCQSGDDPPSGRIRQQFDPGSISLWHVMSSVASSPSPAITPRCFVAMVVIARNHLVRRRAAPGLESSRVPMRLAADDAIVPLGMNHRDKPLLGSPWSSDKSAKPATSSRG